eukprot:TRINITY_DN4702_c0_g1_i1.p1 TRINITY_DN4702_c0_g1~~TRINITY_DN4702_c0_g1_i1.p1  ORF type:complete len:355 (-),score=47.92 TRINITY_DN4702_c0_g1_i1:685-1749(-)
MRHFVFCLLIYPCLAAIFGAYHNSTTVDPAVQDWLRTLPPVRNMYINFNATNLYPPPEWFAQNALPAWEDNSVPFITLQPWPYWANTSTPNKEIAQGIADSFLDEFSANLHSFLMGLDGKWHTGDDRRVYIRLGHEMNGNWYPWSPKCVSDLCQPMKIDQTPQDYQAMWRHVYSKLHSSPAVGLDHIQMVFCPNNFAPYHVSDFYPGDDYVDWMCLDFFNFASVMNLTWSMPADLATDMVNQLRAINSAKPLAIGEYASTSKGNGTTAKGDWIAKTFSYFESASVDMFLYFNIDKETDWAMFGGANGDSVSAGSKVYTEYRAGIDSGLKNNWLIPSNSSNPRLITDKVFATGNV